MMKNKIYTRTGDTGETDLRHNLRVRKTDPRIEICGTLDELNAHIGLLVAQLANNNHKEELNNRRIDCIGCFGQNRGNVCSNPRAAHRRYAGATSTTTLFRSAGRMYSGCAGPCVPNSMQARRTTNYRPRNSEVYTSRDVSLYEPSVRLFFRAFAPFEHALQHA